jgi:hypothetical protein
VILIVNQAIRVPYVQHNLLNHMQMRLNYVVVNETPKFQCMKPMDLSHNITVKGDNAEDEFVIPLELRGVVSCFATMKPTQDEFDICKWYELVYESPVYDPSRPSHAKQYADMMDSRGGALEVAEESHPLMHQLNSTWQKKREIVQLEARCSDTTMKLQDFSLALDDSNVNIYEVEMSSEQANMWDGGRVYSATLATNWGIGIEVAKKMHFMTTQRVAKQMIHPSISKSFRKNEIQLRCYRLPLTF